MRRLTAARIAWGTGTLLAALVFGLLADGPAESAVPAHDHSPVLLELFTSQGCSSCPPADRLLSRLGREPELAGQVLPLAFHVDYWNRLGWRDPFSAPAWSARQRAYATRLPGEGVYTPQLVVDGHAACVGSDESTARRLIREAVARPPTAALEARTVAISTTGIDLNVHVRLKPVSRRATTSELYAVLFSNGQTTRVTAGENADRTLRNDYVVRRLTRLATISAAGNHEVRGHVDWPPGMTRRALGAAVFLQDPASGRVLAARRVPIDGR